MKDERLFISWFRVQVLHCYLIRHSIEELLPSLRGNIMVLVATLINHFWPIKTIQELVEQDNAYRNIAIE